MPCIIQVCCDNIFLLLIIMIPAMNRAGLLTYMYSVN